ncbi:MAG TPA: helix-turn-helix transcriptional regulator [Terrimicrobiaceae bacterium]|nr:helix-turn-helix transcriptional regulator [Terrimicrobiaceae bacterium]
MKPSEKPAFQLPPPGRPHWRPQKIEEYDLLYLAWGRRKYGDNPATVSLHDGWTYLAVISGSPVLVRPGLRRRLHREEAVVIDPGCAYGWDDVSGATCEIISWIWRSPAPETHDPFALVNLSPRHLQRLKAIHALCREETQYPDRHSRKVLAGLRAQLDAVLLRAGSPRVPAGNSEWRLHLALEWLRTQISAAEPVSALCDYLQVSPSTLNRLFHAHLGKSAKEHIHEARMEYALSLRPRLQVKEIAALLGYHHPNDLSRAMKDFRTRREQSSGASERTEQSRL